MNESCLPPTDPLLALCDSRLGLLHVLPPSVESETTIGSGAKVLLSPKLVSAPTNRVQLTCTVPKNGLLGFESTQMKSLSLKSTGLSVVLAITGADQWAPSSLERDTATTGKAAGFDDARLP